MVEKVGSRGGDCWLAGWLVGSPTAMPMGVVTEKARPMRALRAALRPASTAAEPTAKPSKNWCRASAMSSVVNADPAVTPSVMPISTAGGEGAGERAGVVALWRCGVVDHQCRHAEEALSLRRGSD